MANPPPFYSLKMSDGSGQGASSAEQTPIDTLQEGYEQGLVEGEAGGVLGTFIYTGTQDPDEGDVAPGYTFDIGPFTTQDDGERYECRFSFTGPDDDAFEVVGFKRGGATYTRDTAFQCDSGEQFSVSVDQPSGGGTVDFYLTLRTVYKDGAQSLMGLRAKDGDTIVEDLIVRATVQDAWLAAGEDASRLGVFVVDPNQADGDVTDADAVLHDVTTTSAVDLIAKIAATGNWLYDSAGPASAGLLTRSVDTQANRGATDRLLAANDLAGLPAAGQIVFYVDTAVSGTQFFELFAPNGKVGTEGPNDPYIGWVGTGDGNGCHYYYAGFLDSIPSAPTLSGWFTMSWNKLNTTPAGETHFWLSKVGESFGGVGTLESALNWAAIVSAGFRMFKYIPTSNYVGQTKVAGVQLFTDNTLASSKLEAMHDAIT